METFEVVCAAGSLRDGAPNVVRMPHRWTDDGVEITAAFTGAHLLHLAIAGCVLNDVYREAVNLAVPIDGVRVSARGGFDEQWASTGVEYEVTVDSAADPVTVERLASRVDDVAEIPAAVRAGARVRRQGSTGRSQTT